MPPVGFEPTISAGVRPKTARPLGPAIYLLYKYIFIIQVYIYYTKPVAEQIAVSYYNKIQKTSPTL